MLAGRVATLGVLDRTRDACRGVAPSATRCMNTHYAVIVFSGDPSGEHPCPELNGSSPTMSMIASGNEEFCWNSIARWTAKNPLRMWEKAEILARHESVAGSTQTSEAHS